jgi:hypothetical protein
MRQNYQIYEQFPSYEDEEALKFPVFLMHDYALVFEADKSICPLLIKNSDSKILAFWLFQEEQNYWSSPVSAPFTCVQLYEGIDFNELLNISFSYLKNKCDKPIRFVINPLFAVLQKIQFSKILNVELNHFIEVDTDSFNEKLPQKKRKQKLRALKRKDYEVTKICIEQWKEVYQQNLNWRIQKGHQNYIPLDLMCKFRSTFPENYIGFQLAHDNTLIGCAFLVRVSNDYLYLYSLITDPKSDRQEPSLLMYETIYDYALSNEITILDLGTSMNQNGDIHKNIAHYKQGIGASAIRKYTFEC